MKLKKTVLGILCLAAASTAVAQEKPVVQFIATGGTIAMKIDPIKKAPVRRQHIALRNAVDRGVKGVVVQALGMGNMNVSMFEGVKYAISKQVPVVISTRVYNGRVLPNYGFEGGGKTVADAGAVMADDLSPQKARILLMLSLQNEVSSQADLQAAFDR